MASKDLLARVERDVADGRPWKARDRLGGALANDPHDIVALDRLGDVSWAMGDGPAAGRAWLLAGRDDERAREAVAALAERVPAPGQRLRALGPRAPLSRYPAPAQAKIEALRAEAGEAGDRWSPRSAPGAAGEASGRDVAIGHSVGAAVLLIALTLLTLGVWLVGAGFLVWLAVRTFT